METPSTAAAKKGPDIHVLHCLNPDCRGLLAYEVDSNNVLYVDLDWTARTDGNLRYFPCPKCHGKNLIEPLELAPGRTRHRVTCWQP